MNEVRGAPAASEIPLLPLQTVLFPGGRLPLRLFEQRYLGMAKRCFREDLPFGVCAIRDGREVGAPAVPFEVGCLAQIVEWDMPQLGVLNIVAAGTTRFRIRARRVAEDGLALGEIEPLPDARDARLPDKHAACAALVHRVLEDPNPPPCGTPRLDSADWVGARLAEWLPLPLGFRQQLLECDDALDRLATLHAAIASALERERG